MKSSIEKNKEKDQLKKNYESIHQSEHDKHTQMSSLGTGKVNVSCSFIIRVAFLLWSFSYVAFVDGSVCFEYFSIKDIKT